MENLEKIVSLYITNVETHLRLTQGDTRQKYLLPSILKWNFQPIESIPIESKRTSPSKKEQTTQSSEEEGSQRHRCIARDIFGIPSTSVIAQKNHKSAHFQVFAPRRNGTREGRQEAKESQPSNYTPPRNVAKIPFNNRIIQNGIEQYRITESSPMRSQIQRIHQLRTVTLENKRIGTMPGSCPKNRLIPEQIVQTGINLGRI